MKNIIMTKKEKSTWNKNQIKYRVYLDFIVFWLYTHLLFLDNFISIKLINHLHMGVNKYNVFGMLLSQTIFLEICVSELMYLDIIRMIKSRIID